MSDVYRSAASLIVLRPPKAGGVPQMLLLHKPRKRDAWQLPQGGCEAGESIEEAALRELKEEAGIDAQVLGASREVYKYDFPPSFRKFRPDNVCGQSIAFVFAVADPDVRVTVDAKEVDKHVWTDRASVGRYVRREEYLRLIERLYDVAVAHWKVSSRRARGDTERL